MLKAKLHAPAIDRNTINREKLLQKLGDAPEYKLTLVTAPAGYGKTTAVLQWLERCGLPYAWLSLGSRDNDPGVFWGYVCSALDGIIGGVVRETEYVLSFLEMLKANIHIDILIDRLAGAESDFILVLDDLHYITDPSVIEGLSYLVEYLPAKMHLIFISRAVPDFNLAKYKLKRQIQCLEEKDLRFGEDEIFLFYRARGIILENDDVKKVKSYTEGWAAAMVAVAMSVEDGGNRGIINGLKGSGKDIGQYLHNEILSIWSDEKRDFALKTCILDTLSPDICDALTGGGDARRLLAEIHAGNGFLIALDAEGREYRYHHLFRSFLQKLLAKTAPDEIPRLHARAGFWLRERGMMPEAIEHLLDGGLFPEALELIENHAGSLLLKNDFHRILPWIGRLPEEYKNKSLKIAGAYALYYAGSDSFELSRRWVERMKAIREERLGNSPPQKDDERLTVICALVEANLLMREGNPDFAWLLHSAAESKAHKMPGYLDLNVSDIYFFRCPSGVLIKLLRQSQGQFDRTIGYYREMISENPGYAPLSVGEYYYESNQLREALPYLISALEEARAAGCPGSYMPVMVNLARIKRASGDVRGAVSVLKECESKLKDMGEGHWSYLTAAFRCRLYIDMGDAAGVDGWLAAGRLDICTGLSKAREFELIVYARALIFKGRTDDAKLLLIRLLSFAEQTKRHHSKAEILILLALLYYGENDVPESMNHLENALSLGLREGYVRSFLDEFAPMAKPLGCYISHKIRQTGSPEAEALVAFAKNLSRQIQEYVRSAPQSAGSTAGAIWELLTAQEKKVLELLSEANTNLEIGQKLGISLATVKTHTGNIYGKIGVKNRAQCIKLIQKTDIL